MQNRRDGFSSGLIQLLFREEFRHHVSHLFVIQVGEREVGISMDADFREVHNCHVAAMTVDCVPPLSRHLQPNTPAVLTWIIAWLVGDKVAVVDDDRNLGEFHELSHGNTNSRQRPTGA
jgi:hypothetical protein